MLSLLHAQEVAYTVVALSWLRLCSDMIVYIGIYFEFLLIRAVRGS